tara:strand:+ start:291 stop:494 length:204 start_codon:yes stop_codon:yes gene_type:complete
MHHSHRPSGGLVRDSRWSLDGGWRLGLWSQGAIAVPPERPSAAKVDHALYDGFLLGKIANSDIDESH